MDMGFVRLFASRYNDAWMVCVLITNGRYNTELCCSFCGGVGVGMAIE